jgi:hypothetical protein
MVRGNFLATSEAPLSLTPRPQVLFKRKPVQFLPVPEIEDENQEVWHISQTGEVFLTYEDYLNRLDFYSQVR